MEPVLFMGEPAFFKSVYERGIREGLLKFSLIIVASVPVLRIYRFVQKYFARGVQEQSITFGRTHNLIALLDLLLPLAGAWEDARPHLEILNVPVRRCGPLPRRVRLTSRQRGRLRAAMQLDSTEHCQA